MSVDRGERDTHRSEHHALERRGNMLGGLVDCLIEGAAIYRTDGRLVHRNPALARLAADDPERDRLVREMTRLVSHFAAVAERERKHRGSSSTPGDVLRREVRTARARYVMRAKGMGSRFSRARALIVVLVERLAPRRLVPEEVRSRFHLTPRELEVSQLLARGRSTAELARTLGISIHTARRHAEHVLGKLGVHSRVAAVAKLRID